jgi:isoleucyl-tRNA synthetase
MYDFKKTEQEVFDYWEKNKIHEKANENNKKGKSFYFLDGPPYTSGKVHLGTAWNKSLKDCVLRFRRMQGFKVWDRAGYDMHGLPTAHKVMEELGFKYKEDIEKYGVDKFVVKCRELSVKNMHIMNKDFKRLGVWMDFENAYQSVKPEFIEGVWWLVKKAHENKRLYEGKLSMTWCKDCATALAKHELIYNSVSDDSIFLKFPVLGSENEFLVIWTTTPWTIPYNLAVMVHPELDYVRAKVGDEVWIVGKGLVNTFINGVVGKEFTILEEFKGETIDGLKYKHPLYDELKQVYDELIAKSEKVFSVVMSSEYVDFSAGTGLVHTAPGCGPEDFEVGHREGIPPFNNLDQQGVFPDSMGKFAGLVARKDDRKFIEHLKETGQLIAVTQVDHDYAHCWRCKNGVIYRTTKQWFFKIEDLTENMRELNKSIYWVPGFAGSRNFDSWLANLRDNGITRQRYWGTPLPVWKCKECNDYVVVGSVKELKELAGTIPEDLHKPWIDEVVFDCKKCKGKMHRIPDILDVWIDAGSASWLCLDYPHREDLFKKMFPADFILEGIDQIRGWFNMLFVASMVSMEKPSFKSVYMHGFINDAQGRKMSKSLGNYILPEEVLEKYGADTLRYYMIGGTNPGVDINYNFDDMKVKFRNLSVLWNLHELLLSYSKLLKVNPSELDVKELGVEEKFMMSRLHSTILGATEIYDKYLLTDAPNAVEALFLDLSRKYVKFVRDVLSVGSEEEKRRVLWVVYNVVFESIRLLSPITPYICEAIYLNLKEQFNLKEESVHLCGWPKADKKMIDNELEMQFEALDQLTQKILYARERAGLGVRWPLPEVVVVSKDEITQKAVKKLAEIVKTQTNVKKLTLKEDFEAKVSVKADYNKIRKEYSGLSAQIIAHLAMTSSETIMHHVKESGDYNFRVDNANVVVKLEHLIVEKDAPKGFVYAAFNKGDVFVNTDLTKELEAEGYARELVRRVQSMRKKAGMKKSDEIDLYVHVDKELKSMLDKHKDDVKERVGATAQVISELAPSKPFENKKDFEIRGRKLEVFLSKL